MCEIGEYIERLEGKIERQREQLARLRAKKNRCLLDRADTYRRAIQRQKELELLCLSLKSDIKSLSEDNERLRAEIVRLSGGEKSSERITGASRLALKAMESKSICPGCAFFIAGFNGGFFCRHHSLSREIYFLDIVDTGRPRWCPL